MKHKGSLKRSLLVLDYRSVFGNKNFSKIEIYEKNLHCSKKKELKKRFLTDKIRILTPTQPPTHTQNKNNNSKL